MECDDKGKVDGTLASESQMAWFCSRSMASRSFRYHVSRCVSGTVVVNACDHSFSSFTHCSYSFLLLLCAVLRGKGARNGHGYCLFDSLSTRRRGKARGSGIECVQRVKITRREREKTGRNEGG